MLIIYLLWIGAEVYLQYYHKFFKFLDYFDKIFALKIFWLMLQIQGIKNNIYIKYPLKVKIFKRNKLPSKKALKYTN